MSHPVINGGGDGTSKSSTSAGPNTSSQSTAQPQPQPNQQQQQPHPHPRAAFSSPFSSAGRFPFDDSDDDMFGDLDMRARMGRMGAFDWGAHKRDADSFFNQHSSDPFGQHGFGHHFDSPFAHRARTGSAGRRTAAEAAGAAGGPTQQHQQQPTPQSPNTSTKAATDRSHFYDHLPEEFRQYFPESFGHSFVPPRMNRHYTGAGSGGIGVSASPPTASFMRQHHPQQQQQPQQTQQHFVPTASAPAAADAAGTTPAPRPNVCDAAIQTDCLPTGNELQQPSGLRNTVDLGQRSEPDTAIAAERAQSAPPTEPLQTPAAAAGYANQGTSMTPQQPQQQQQQKQRANTSPFVYPQQQQQQTSSAQSPASAGERHVPIFVEGRSPAGAAPPQPPQRASVPLQQQQQQPQQPQQQTRPTPLLTQSQPPPPESGEGAVPQTPHTVDCIGKIQAIQADVLDLMAAVDRFAGCRKDKEYAYIDEMLTRNLLKLDTIDTQGRESIRLARKEAIRCIQASITVLEAKAEQNGLRKKAEEEAAAVGGEQKVVDGQAPEVVASVASEQAADNVEQSLEERLADFQRKSEDREQVASAPQTPVEAVVATDVAAPEPAEPETHVSAVQINLKPVAKTN